MLLLLQSSPLFFTTLSGILGLVVGSFLNVVIHRLPKMMQREWHSQCAELTEYSGSLAALQPAGTAFCLSALRSRHPRH